MSYNYGKGNVFYSIWGSEVVAVANYVQYFIHEQIVFFVELLISNFLFFLHIILRVVSYERFSKCIKFKKNNNKVFFLNAATSSPYNC